MLFSFLVKLIDENTITSMAAFETGTFLFIQSLHCIYLASVGLCFRKGHFVLYFQLLTYFSLSAIIFLNKYIDSDFFKKLTAWLYH